MQKADPFVPTEETKHWRFVTNHGLALLIISQEKRITALEMSRRMDITERSVRSLIRDLEQAGYINKTRQGRTNVYSVNEDKFLRHAELSHAQIGDLLELLKGAQ